MFERYYRYWNSASWSYISRPCRGEGKDVRTDSHILLYGPTTCRRAQCGSIQRERHPPSRFVSLRGFLQTVGTKHVWPMWEWLHEISQTLVKNFSKDCRRICSDVRKWQHVQAAFHGSGKIGGTFQSAETETETGDWKDLGTNVPLADISD